MRDFVLNLAMALGRKADFTARSCSLTSHVTKAVYTCLSSLEGLGDASATPQITAMSELGLMQ